MYLLDTNVVSEFRKVRSGKANPGVTDWSKSVPASALFLSVITLQELESGILLAALRDTRKANMLRTWMNDYVRPTFAGRILPVDEEVALSSAAFHVPNPRPLHDSLIAATAKVHGMIMVTRDEKDFARFDVQLLNPWS